MKISEDVLEEINIGLSDAEKSDLEEMITVFRNNQSEILESQDSTSDEKKLLKINEKLCQYSNVLLKFDKKLKLLYEIFRLSDQKNRIMNQRINAILELLKRQNLMNEK